MDIATATTLIYLVLLGAGCAIALSVLHRRLSPAVALSRVAVREVATRSLPY